MQKFSKLVTGKMEKGKEPVEGKTAGCHGTIMKAL
jgi:hypothetical protein